MSLSKEDFLAPASRRVEPVELPVRGGSVFVRRLFVDEQIQYEAETSALDDSDTKGFTAVSVAFYLCTETGDPFVTLADMRAAIDKLDPNDVGAVMAKGIELNLDPRKLATVEEAAKN